MLEQDLRALNSRIDSLINKIQLLSAENHSLKQGSSNSQQLQAQLDIVLANNQKLSAKETAWQTERQQLIAEKEELSRKNDHARARVEAIILRLKALESSES
jgi:cell division protein ZapB